MHISLNFFLDIFKNFTSSYVLICFMPHLFRLSINHKYATLQASFLDDLILSSVRQAKYHL